jgi:drug/metabolite transporter (DMT)-like permease
MCIAMKDYFASATIKGYLAILLWSFSALFISWTPQIPSLFMASLTSAVGFTVFGCSWIANPSRFKTAIKQSWHIWLLFFTSVIVYRGLYIGALKLAPIVESNLLNYLWPIFIVIFSAVHDKRWPANMVLLSAILCFVGVICIGISKNDAMLHFEVGHILAILAALTWAIYSVFTRRFLSDPTDNIGFMHFVAILIFGILHFCFEESPPREAFTMLSVVGMISWGLSISLGYILWDQAMTHGRRENVAVAAYYTPLLSTLWLFLFNGQPMTIWVWCAAVLILGGSLLARMAPKA